MSKSEWWVLIIACKWVPNIEFDFNVSVRHCLLSTYTSKSNLTLATHLHAMIRTYHFDFDIRIWSINTLLSKTLHQSRIWRWELSVIYAYDQCKCSSLWNFLVGFHLSAESHCSRFLSPSLYPIINQKCCCTVSQVPLWHSVVPGNQQRFNKVYVF